ncbi:hypothetical protein H0A62_05500 [Pusillimonas harenae]|uniref:DNA binding HTH domain-containing protein n=1 Tax=Pollutimonas harenae TaxID=657015 RepID=A0A853H3C3_9BURK|nr:hypothetical protein [Pollutimonas harenae]
MQALNDPVDALGAGAARVLLEAAIRLQRFDACLIPVSPQNLGWARMALSAANGVLHTPVLALVRDLKAGALNDLYTLGLADFVRDPLCTEELRVRIDRLLDARRYNAGRPSSTSKALSEVSGTYSQPSVAAMLDESAMHQTILERSGLELEAFAIASASRCATTKESFRVAKSQVIERFERAYIKAALGRHSGNIAMAARAAQKHRRAFWALMRKHDIDAAPFRVDPGPNLPRDG